jgi:plasmid stabilization system protein ParE
VKLTFRPQLYSDVEQCADSLATEAGEAVAAAWYQSLKKALDPIQRMPEIGRVRHDLPMDGIRTLNLRKHPNYLVFHRHQKGCH